MKRVCHQEAGAMIGLVMTTGATVEDAIAMMIAVTEAPSLCGRRDVLSTTSPQACKRRMRRLA